MSILSVVVVLCVVGVLLWLVNSYVPMAAPFPRIITAVVVVATALWLLSVFGLLGAIGSARLPRVR